MCVCVFFSDSVSAPPVCWKVLMPTAVQPALGGMKDSTAKGTMIKGHDSINCFCNFIISL